MRHRTLYGSLSLGSLLLGLGGIGAQGLGEGTTHPISHFGTTPTPPTIDPAKILETDAAGRFVMPWTELAATLAQVQFDYTKGEFSHPLYPFNAAHVQAMASIFPAVEIWRTQENDLIGGRIVALVVSTGEQASQGYYPGENYLMVWWKIVDNKRTPTMAVLNKHRRYIIPQFTYTKHGAADATSQNVKDLKGLSFAALTCVASNKRACFIDSPDEQRAGGISGGAMGLDKVMLYESQPWVSCVLIGCCCGGHQCHQ